MKRRNLKIGLTLQFIVAGAPLMADLFIPQFAETLGATKLEIGILGAVFALLMFFSAAIFGRMSDTIGRKKILFLGFFSTGLFYAISFFSKSFSNFFVLRALQGVSIGIYPGALAAYVNENNGTMDDYSASGALGIALFMWVSGMIAGIVNIRWIFISVGISYFISLFLATHIREEHIKSLDVPLFPMKVIMKNINLYLAIFFTFTGITITWTFWILFLDKLGATPFAAGYITMINPLCEFLTLKFIANRIRFRSTALGILILSVSFPLFAFARNLSQIIPLQILSGMGWAFMYAGSLNDIMKNNNEKGTATGILQSSISLGNIVGPFVAGLIALVFKDLKYEFIFAGIIIFFGFILFQRKHNKELSTT